MPTSSRVASRRAILARAGLLGAGLAVGGTSLVTSPAIVRARDLETFTFFTPFGFNADFIEVMNAKAAGYFAQEGLDVLIQGAQGTAQTMQQLVSGGADLIRSAQIDQMKLVSKQKQPIQCVSTLYQSSNFFMISARDKPVEKAEDLRGKTVGVVSVNGSTDTFLNLILGKVGLEPDDVRRQTTGNSPGALQFVKQGRVDCFIGTLSVIVPLERMGEKITYWSTDRYAPMPCQGYMALRENAAKRSGATVAFPRAVKRSADEILDRPLKPVYERAAKEFEIPGIRDLDTIVAVTQTWRQLLLSQGRENLLRNVPALWTSGLDLLSSAGIISIKDPSAFYTDAYIDAALKA